MGKKKTISAAGGEKGDSSSLAFNSLWRCGCSPWRRSCAALCCPELNQNAVPLILLTVEKALKNEPSSLQVKASPLPPGGWLQPLHKPLPPPCWQIAQ